MARTSKKLLQKKQGEHTRKTRVFCIANQKGGVGKTTTTVNLGAALQEMGREVLLIDLDPQGSLGMAFGLDADSLQYSVYDVLLSTIREDEERSFAEIIMRLEIGLSLAPANITLAAAEVDLSRATMGELVLREAISPLLGKYDDILIDCPPNLGLLTINALSAAHQVIIPLQADYLAMKGVDLLTQTIDLVQRKINPHLVVAGILMTMADMRTAHSREVILTTQETLEHRVHVFSSVVRTHVRVKEAPVAGKSVLAYAPTSQAAQAYRELAREITPEEAEGLRLISSV
jgi:chromosome partitioning protein